MPEIQQDISLQDRNTLRLPARAEFFLVAGSNEAVIEGLVFARERGLPVTILGGGSNVVFTGDIPGLVISMAVSGIRVDGTELVAGAGESWHGVVQHSIQHGLSGLENLSLIPGSVGAAPIQNIGAYGVELESVFHSLEAIDRESLTTVTMNRAECRFGYRDSVFKREHRNRYVITGVTLNLARDFRPTLSYGALAEVVSAFDGELTPAIVSEMVCNIRRSKLPDPAVIGNVGSFFKNPLVSRARLDELRVTYPEIPHWASGNEFKVSAGWLIERCGLKGYSRGDARVAPNHALVITNEASATNADVLGLAEHIKTEVQVRFDLLLEIEPTVIEVKG